MSLNLTILIYYAFFYELRSFMKKHNRIPITKALIESSISNNYKFSYDPLFAKLTGSVNAAILLKSILYLSEHKNRKMFYKFKEKPKHKHPAYKEGDSWLEVLGWGRTKFDNALKIIGTKITSGTSKIKALKDNNISNLVIYWTDKSHMTWYLPNYRLLDKVHNTLYSYTDDNERYPITINTTNNHNVNSLNPSGPGTNRGDMLGSEQLGSESPLDKVQDVLYLRDSDKNNNNLLDYNKVQAYFITTYNKLTNESHPPLTAKHAQEITTRMAAFDSEYGVENNEDWYKMIEAYFHTRFDRKQGVDYRIFHFVSEGILLNLWNHTIFEDRKS